MTKFFKPISVSATHIYHSALELCPLSSIIRKLYYDRCHGVTRLPRVVTGTPDSWDTTISLSSKDGYGFCAWSPCGQFIAAQTGQTVEIRNHLTFELLTVLQSTKYTPLPRSPLVYSPDGRSLACCFSGGIAIWDIQTGGVANEIKSDKRIASLVWSLDGSMVATTWRFSTGASGGSRDRVATAWRFGTGVETYNIFSGAQLFTQQFGSRTYVYLWAHEKSFRLMEAVSQELDRKRQSLTYTISEIGPTLIEIESSSLTTGNPYSWTISEIAFSPSTHHIATFGSSIFIYDIRTSHRLLQDPGHWCTFFQFSPDGSHFASSSKYSLRVFQRNSGSYTLLWESLFRHENDSSRRITSPFSSNPSQHDGVFQFSPTSSSILSKHDGILQVRRLSNPPIAFNANLRSTAISPSGRYIATARNHGTTVSIIDLRSLAPSQFIDTGFDVWELDITGNVLVVMGDDGAAGWLLTEEGMVDDVFSDQRVSESDSKWTLPAPPIQGGLWNLWADGGIGVITAKACDEKPLYYSTNTGDVLMFGPSPRHHWHERSTEGGLHHHPTTTLYLKTP